jgi:N-acetyl sugar amidotransferase
MSVKNNIKKPDVSYCSNCTYPSSSAVSLFFDKNFVCSGCEVSKEKASINWQDRERELHGLLKKYKGIHKYYDCVIPVSGGKDSYFQIHTIKKLGFNPLLVTYDANNWTDVSLKNLRNMREVFGCDHILYTPSITTIKKLNIIAFELMGDMNWHAHCGIFTTPIRVASDLNIPLMIWGEHGRTDVAGMFSHSDYIEFTYRARKEHDLRGYEWYDILKISKQFNQNLSEHELVPWMYPEDTVIEQKGIRGIFISNYVKWEANSHLELVIKKYNFQVSEYLFERTYRNFSNLDDMHENGIHDYLKFIKFGYGRATDHTSKDIRAGILDRNDAIKEILKRDHIKSKDLFRWLSYVGKDEKYFDEIADRFRDHRVWWIKGNKWYKKDIDGNERDYGVVRLSSKNKKKYYQE